MTNPQLLPWQKCIKAELSGQEQSLSSIARLLRNWCFTLMKLSWKWYILKNGHLMRGYFNVIRHYSKWHNLRRKSGSCVMLMGKQTLLTISFFPQFLALLFNHRRAAALFLFSCLCLDVHWRHPPLSHRCGRHLQQGLSAQEFLHLWLSQPRCGSWLFSLIRI